MKTFLGEYLLKLWRDKRRRRIAAAVLMVLSLLVATGVIWQLRLTGETQTDDASLLASPEYQRQIADAELLIDGLPEISVIEATIGQYQTAQDVPGLEAYCAKTYSQVKAAFDVYAGLTQEQQAAVTNGERLPGYESILEILKDFANLPDYSAKSGEITAGATLAEGAGLPEDASFAMVTLDQTQNGHAQAREKVTEYLEANQENQMISMTVLDMHFANSVGEQIQVNGQTQVVLDFETPIFTGAGEVRVLHITDAGVENVTKEVIRDENGVSRIIIETGSFSEFPIVQLASVSGDGGGTLDGDYAYLDGLKLSDDSEHVSGYYVRTGTAPWDSDDAAGNDSGEMNTVLRTFDVAQYKITFASHVRESAPYRFYRDGKLYFEFIIQGDQDTIRFEEDAMHWLAAKQATYNITQQTVDGQVCQVLQGWYLWEPETGLNYAIGESRIEIPIAIRSLAGCNGDVVAPKFTLWLDGNVVGQNEDGSAPLDYSAFGTSDYTGGLIYGRNQRCPTHTTSPPTEAQSLNCADVEGASITISAAARYNIYLVNGDEDKYQRLDSYDFSVGNDRAFNKDVGTLYGRMAAYGIAIQIRGKTGQGLRGVELPAATGDITFELDITSQFVYTNSDKKKVTQDVTDLYTPQVWTGAQNLHNDTKNQDIHDPWDRSLDLFNLGFLANVPYNRVSFFSTNSDYSYRSCYDGGYWNVTQDAQTGKYQVTIKNYTLNTDYMPPYSKADGTTITHTYYDPDQVDAYWEVENYIFSTGQIYIVQPFVRTLEDGSELNITSEFDEGTFHVKLSDGNLSLKTKSGDTITQAEDNSNQAVQNDDNRSQSLPLVKPGTHDQVLYYLKGDADNARPSWNDALTEGCYQTGGDWALKGQYATIETHVLCSGCEGTETPVGFDVLIKFDDTFFKPNLSADNVIQYGNIITSGHEEAKFRKDYYQYFWAAKADGTGWDHNDLLPNQAGYDTEMIEAVPEDLVFYSSMAALEADGKVCVGALVQYRGIMSSTVSYPLIYLTGQIQDTALSNQVYMITPYSRVWDRGDLVSALGLTETEVMSMTPEQIHNAAMEAVPYMSTWSAAEQQTQLDAGTPVYDTYPAATWVNGAGEESDGKAGDHRNNILGYQKASYDAEGNLSDPSSGARWGDSCLVIGQRSEITITPQQTVPDGGTKVVYDLDTGQRVVDYSVYPTVISYSENTPGEKTYTVTVTLPKGLTYVQSSSIYRGTKYYQLDPNGGVQGNWTTWGESHWGRFTDGGVKTGYKPDDVTPHTLKLTIVSNEDGTTTLLYEITTTLAKLYPIRFSARIGSEGTSEDVVSGEQLTVMATVTSTEEAYLPISETYGNLANTTITVNKTKSTSLAKFADQPVVEAGDPVGYNMSIHNEADTAQNVLALDSLPYVGDGISEFSGTLTVTEFSVQNPQELDMTQLRFYYTTDETLREKRAKDFDAATFPSGSESWIELEVDSTGSAVIPEGGFSPYHIAVSGSVPAKTSLDLHITLNLEGGRGGNVLYNELTRGSLASTAECRIVSRTLEGLAWIDLNHDGLQDATETLQNGIKVELVEKTNGTTVATVETGYEWDIIANSRNSYQTGYYRFTNVPAGEYTIRFSSGTFDLKYYYGSPQDAGKNDAIDSDAQSHYSQEASSFGHFDRSVIPTVTMPEASGLTYASHVVLNMDAGFYSWGVILPATGGAGTPPYIISGLLLMSVSLLVYSVMRKQRRKGAR